MNLLRHVSAARLSINRVLWLAISTLGLLGCWQAESDPYHRNPVQGTVILDGEPLVEGSIVFFPETQGPVVTGCGIRGGEFSIPKHKGLPAGRYKVSITSPLMRRKAQASSSDPMESDEDSGGTPLLPERYNSNTTLTSEVTNSPENCFHFELDSQGSAQSVR